MYHILDTNFEFFAQFIPYCAFPGVIHDLCNKILVHSKLRPNYPMPKIPKNCPRHDIKSGNSPRSGKVRRHQKSGCFPASKGARGQKPNGSTMTKMHLNRIHLLTQK